MLRGVSGRVSSCARRRADALARRAYRAPHPSPVVMDVPCSSCKDAQHYCPQCQREVRRLHVPWRKVAHSSPAPAHTQLHATARCAVAADWCGQGPLHVLNAGGAWACRGGGLPLRGSAQAVACVLVKLGCSSLNDGLYIHILGLVPCLEMTSAKALRSPPTGGAGDRHLLVVQHGRVRNSAPTSAR